MEMGQGFLEEINDLQLGMEGVDQISVDDELKSIVESKRSIAERLPESHDDGKTKSPTTDMATTTEERPAAVVRQQISPTQDVAARNNHFLPILLIGLIMVLVYFALHKRRMRKSTAV